MDYYDHISAVILAGGKNSRFQGKVKTLELLHSRPLIIHQLNTLQNIFKEIMIISNTKELLKQYVHMPIYEDIYKGKGPLGGIYTGLIKANTRYVFIFGGDMPFLNEDLITSQTNQMNLKNWEAIVPQTIKGIEPLHSIYDTHLHKRLEKMLAEPKTFPIRKLFTKAETYYWQVNDQNAFININSPEELTFYNSNIEWVNKMNKNG